eukprot:UN10013
MAIFTMVFGGINAQIEHHIAPYIYPVYYALAARQMHMKEGAIEVVVDYHTFLHRFAQNVRINLLMFHYRHIVCLRHHFA